MVAATDLRYTRNGLVSQPPTIPDSNADLLLLRTAYRRYQVPLLALARLNTAMDRPDQSRPATLADIWLSISQIRQEIAQLTPIRQSIEQLSSRVETIERASPGIPFISAEPFVKPNSQSGLA